MNKLLKLVLILTSGILILKCTLQYIHAQQIIEPYVYLPLIVKGETFREKIAFMTDRDGNYEIYTMNPDGAEQANLTNHPSQDYNPAWSPDGTRMAFGSDRDGNGELYIIDVNGSGLIRLTNEAEGDYAPAWSPDGTQVAFSTFRDGNEKDYFNSEIYIMKSNGTDLIRLTNNLINDFFPAWSPDGTKIIFFSEQNGVEINLINSDGSGLVRLASGYSPSWSPDGTKIAFVGVNSTYLERWNPKFMLINYRYDTIFSPNAHTDIYTMNADGSGITNLTNTPGWSDAAPTWSPDGSQIAFQSSHTGNSEIYIVDVQGGKQVNLTNHLSNEYTAKWKLILLP
jgi:Tol biopolymer transport system component